MNPAREEALFAAALDRPPAERAIFLDGACLGDDALRARVEALLAAHDATANPLATQPGGATTLVFDAPDIPDEAVGHQIGRYKLLEKVGEGGCGVVYVAEQTEPVRRRVALKVIKLGMDTRQVVARFEAERQALAMMDHPNIAKVLDAGTTDKGRPFFVMELVRGIPITHYADQANLTTRDRLELFIKVCQAIQHAHQKGIIHRDIKPSNILVTLHDGVPVPKVIDFGIAKATDGRLTDNTVYTQLHQFIGTPAYMSPEQAEMSGLDIDTRSDIYSLGVLLYELLAGSTPFDSKELMASGIDAMRRTIREKEPPRPSTRLATLGADQLTTTAKRRSAETSKLLHQLKGDLDWIVMKCLEKDRQRRYDTANGLAADLRRHLDNEPVTARPPSPAYKFQKAWRRNKLIFGTGTVVIAALLAGIAFSTWQASVASRANKASIHARAETEREAEIAQRERDKAVSALALADQKTQEAQLRLYAADMKLAQLALEGNDLKRANALLDRHRPAPGAADLRGFEWRYLWQQARSQDIGSIATSNGIIRSLAFSPDKRWLAVAGSAGASILKVESWTGQVRLEEGTSLHSIDFSPDGESLLAGGPTNGLRIWDTLTWRLKGRLDDRASYGAFSPDGRLVIGGGPDGLRVWDSRSLKLLQHATNLTLRQQWSGRRGPMGNLGFSADGRFFAAAVEDSLATTNAVAVRVWTVDALRDLGPAAPGRSIRFPEVHSVLALALNEDGSRLAVSTTIGSLSLWDVAHGTRLAVLRGALRSWSLQFRPGHDEIVGARLDNTLPLWRYSEGTLKQIGSRRGHMEEALSLAAAPGGSRLATGDESGVVKLWDLTPHDDQPPGPVPPGDTLSDHLGHIQFLADGRTLVANEMIPERVSFIDLERRQRRRVFTNVVWHAGAVVSPNDRWILLARPGGEMELRDIASEALVATLRGHTNEVRRICFSPDSRRAVTATIRMGSIRGDAYLDDVWVRLWEIPTGRLLAETALPGKLRDIALSPDGSRLAVVLENGRCLLHRATDLGFEFEMPSENAFPERLAWSPDGSILAACGDLVHFWDMRTRSLRFGSTRGKATIAFSPDGRTLASTPSGGTRELKLVNVATGQEMLGIPLGASLYQAVFNHDGTTLAVGTYRIEGADEFYNVHLIKVPSLADIAAIEAGNPPPRP